MRHRPIALLFLATLGFPGLCTRHLGADELTLELPDEGEFIRDLSSLLNQKTKIKINEICIALKKEQNTRFIIITIISAALSTFGTGPTAVFLKTR